MVSTCLRALYLSFLMTLGSIGHLYSQDDQDALFIKSIHNQILTEGSCYAWLDHLSEEIGGRLAGSEESEIAVRYTRDVLSEYADTAYLQPCQVPYWTRGDEEVVKILNTEGNLTIDIGGLALGNSVGTGAKGIQAEVVEVKTLDEVRALGIDGINGKIVFYNRPMDPTQIRTFYAYGGAVDQRVNGPAVAAEYGAIGTIVRSMTTASDDNPHTGVTRYKEGGPQIPAIAISTNDADLLHEMLQKEPVDIYMYTNCRMVTESKLSYNVIAEIKGSTYPDEIILVGGHMDSWDVGGGAHDDGAGCVHSMQVFETLKELNYQPKRTLRCVLFMNEENGLGGGRAYAEESAANGEWHMAAIESDAGGFTPRGFSCDANDDIFPGFYRQLLKWTDLLDPYYLGLTKGGSGADISPLKSQGGLLMGFRPDSQRYFDFHHTAVDRITAVNERELKLGAAAMTSMVYLLDNYGISKGDE